MRTKLATTHIIIATALLAACTTTNTVKSPSPSASSTPPPSPPAQVTTDSSNYAQRAQVKAFVNELNGKYGYSKTELLGAFANAERMDTVLRQLEKDKPNPNFKKNWKVYRSRYVEPLRIKAGVS